MLREIRESDWKQFRRLHELALERFCARVLSEIREIEANADRTNYERYGQIYGLLDRRNREMSNAFDDPRRSMAKLQLVQMQSLGLITDIDTSVFSEDVREFLERAKENA